MPLYFFRKLLKNCPGNPRNFNDPRFAIKYVVWKWFLDIDECTSPEHNPCSQYATCANTVGSVTCECKKGFVGDGFTCTDINECELGDHTCAPLGGQCFNKPGGFGCRCAPGFVGNGWKCNGTCVPFSYEKSKKIWFDFNLSIFASREKCWQILESLKYLKVDLNSRLSLFKY